MRRFISAVLAAALCLSALSACRSSGISESAQLGSAELEQLEELNTPYVGMVLKSLDNQFYPLIKAGAEAEANKLGVELIVVAPESENDADEQAELLGIMANMALDVLVIAPCDESTLTDSLARAHSNGKHILAVDEKLRSPFCEGYVGAYDLGAGKREGALAAGVAVSDTAVILSGSANSANHTERAQGITQRLYQSGINVVECVDCASSSSLAYQETTRLLEDYPDLGVICATNDTMAIGAQSAVADAKRDVPVVSLDGTPDVVNLVAQGRIAGVVDQDPYEIGVQAVDAAVQLYEGETVDNVYVSSRIITQLTAQTSLDVLSRRLNEYD